MLALFRPEGQSQTKTPVQTVRADFPHTAYQWSVGDGITRPVAGARIPDGAAQAIESKASKKGRTPPGPTRSKSRAVPLEEQALQPPPDVVIQLANVIGRIARPEVLPPPAQHRIELRDDAAQILVATRRGVSSLTRSHAASRAATATAAGSTRVAASAPRSGRSGACAGDSRGSRSPRVPPRVDQPGLLRMQLQPQRVSTCPMRRLASSTAARVPHITTKSSA